MPRGDERAVEMGRPRPGGNGLGSEVSRPKSGGSERDPRDTRVPVGGSGLGPRAMRVFVGGSGLDPSVTRVFVGGSGLGPRATRVFVGGSGLGPAFIRVYGGGSGLGSVCGRADIEPTRSGLGCDTGRKVEKGSIRPRSDKTWLASAVAAFVTVCLRCWGSTSRCGRPPRRCAVSLGRQALRHVDAPDCAARTDGLPGLLTTVSTESLSLA